MSQPRMLVAIALVFFGLGCTGAKAGEPGKAPAGAIQMQVTEAGFVPNRIKVKKGQPVKLVITRKTDQTCAREIVIDEYKIHTKLPLDTAVTVAFTPDKSGELKYGCAMDKMISGVLVIE